MNRWGKLLLAALPLALLLTAGYRFIQHTNVEYSLWIAFYGAAAARMEARCAEKRTPDICDAARKRRSFVAEFESHRTAVLAWWWPTVVMMALAWAAVLLLAVAAVRAPFHRPRTDQDASERPERSSASNSSTGSGALKK
jgi:hypothetical protein